MSREKTAIPDDLLQLSQRLEEWRRENPPRTRLPEPIWVAAAERAQRHGLHCTTKALRMDYTRLKKRLPPAAHPPLPAPPAFLELLASPAAAPMDYSNCRIFQNKSVPDIVEKIFQDRGFHDYQLKTQGTYEPREYCVQYRETDFNFVSRLLEDEGIFYFFEQTADKHTLVLADDKLAFKACPHKAKARYTPSLGGRLDEDTVLSVEEEHKVNTGTASLADYDFEKPNTKLYATLSGAEPAEYYDYPGKYSTKDDGDHYAKVRLEEREVELVSVRGKSNCMGLECGYKFTLEEHFRDAANQDYTLIALRGSA